MNSPYLPTGCKWDYNSQQCSLDSCSSLSATCANYPNSCAVAIDGSCVNKPTCSSTTNEETCGGTFGDACAWRDGQCVEWSTCEHTFITSDAQCTYAGSNGPNPLGCAWDVDGCHTILPWCDRMTTSETCATASADSSTNPTGCKWDLQASTCSADSCSFSASPAVCDSFPNACHWDTTQGICAAGLAPDAPPSSSSSTGPAGPLQCSVHGADGATCRGAGCYFDVWEQNCFDNVGVVNALHECSYWRGVASWQQACDAHGCFVMGDACYVTLGPGNPGSGPPASVAESNIASWSNVVQVPNSDIFSFNTKIPFVVKTNPNTWWAAAVGSHNSDISGSVTTNWAHCTSFGALSNGKPIFPVNFDFDNQLGLKFNVFDWVKRFRNLNFTPYPSGPQSPATYPIGAAGAPMTSQFETGANYESAMMKTFGNFRTAPIDTAGSDYLIRSVDMSADGNLMDWAWRIKISDVLDCPGVTTNVVGADTTYVVPTGVLQLNPFGGIMGVYNTFYVTQSGSGAMTITPNSRYRSHVYVRNAVIMQGSGADDCGVGSARMFLTYEGIYYGVADPAITVGPRDLGDIHKKSTANQQYETDNAGFKVLSNQYHDEFYGFEGPSCDSTTKTCHFVVRSKSECRVLDSSGDSFRSSAFASAANKALYSATPIPGSEMTLNEAYVSLENKHDFYVDVYTCKSSACTRFNSAPSGIYDSVGVSIDMKAYPQDASNTLTSGFEVSGGLLDKGDSLGPTETDLTKLRVMSVVPALVGGVPALPTELSVESSDFTHAISWRRTLVPVIRLTTPNLAKFDLRIGIGDGQFSMTPVQANGFVMGPTAHYAELKPLMTYVPKNGKINCPMCPDLPVVAANGGGHGVDGFAIPVSNLMTLWPGVQFQGLEISITYFVGGAASHDGVIPSAGGARRLLSTNADSTVTYNGDGSVGVTYFVAVDLTQEIDLSSTGLAITPPPVVDEEEDIPEALPEDAGQKAAVSVAAVLGGNVALGTIAFMLTI